MLARLLFCALVTLALPAGASAAPVASLGKEAAQATVLVARGDFAAAREKLRAAVAGRPDAALHLAQLEGLILRRQGLNREAVQVFRFILSREPNFTPARIELSRTLAEIGDADAAIHQLQIIELGSDDPEIRRQARAYSGDVRSQRPYGFSGYISILPSTNVNKGSGKETFTLGGMEFVIDDESREASGVGVGVGGQAYRAFTIDALTRLTWTGAVDLKKYSGGDDYDEIAFSTNLSLARRFGRIQLEAGPTMDYRLMAWTPYALRYGLTVGGTIDVAPHTRLYAGGTGLVQDFQAVSYRDGWIFLGYAGVRHSFSPALALSVTGKYTVERTKDRTDLDHDDMELTAQIDREWRGGLVTGLALAAGEHQYRDEFAPGSGIAREDSFWSAGLTILNRNWSFSGFSPRLSYEYTRQKSNISFYDYDSHDVNLSLTKLF
ncbi:hypothetical protein ASD64_12720 [Mesorhizobium sp. Root157]|uniref:surface lipoprotein assembly modifier n=1 Tax=Mesorhizobium sp. Root157 TaxID=1736477 RepID=UPI00070203FD|nr:surface lipoprotein assembly modifier [Mesorhizobium sp. Root157]KQZ78204.1 hypothetical protein ASD64_12720 [Mesorhizobium sp. Root157]